MEGRMGAGEIGEEYLCKSGQSRKIYGDRFPDRD